MRKYAYHCWMFDKKSHLTCFFSFVSSINYNFHFSLLSYITIASTKRKPFLPLFPNTFFCLNGKYNWSSTKNVWNTKIQSIFLSNENLFCYSFKSFLEQNGQNFRNTKFEWLSLVFWLTVKFIQNSNSGHLNIRLTKEFKLKFIRSMKSMFASSFHWNDGCWAIETAFSLVFTVRAFCLLSYF